jgi:lysophospholipase L1-like esterase
MIPATRSEAERRATPLRRRTTPPALIVAAAVIATFVVLELGARVAVYGLEYWLPDYRVSADGYNGATWVEAYYREFRVSSEMEWYPYVYWRRRPYSGTFINVEGGGIRRTWQASDNTEAPRVFVMGGSTVWGSGVRDDYTLASHLSRYLAAQHARARVVNYGESGYVTGQSLAMLQELLRHGRVPTVVVFYVGSEDVFAALQNREAGVPQNETNRRLEFNALQPLELGKVWRVLTSGLDRIGGLARSHFVRDTATAPRPEHEQALADRVVDEFCSAARIAQALGREYGFQPLFYWQPVIFSKPRLTSYEMAARERYGYARSFFQRVYATVAAGPPTCAGLRVRDLGGTFAADAAPRYIDAFHLSEDGNAIVAATIGADVIDALREPRR